MSSAVRCRQVGGIANLSLQLPGATGTLFEAAPRPAGTRAARPITLPSFAGSNYEEIARRIRKIITAILPDRSGSMYGAWGGDPSDVCGAAAESLFELVRRSGGGRALIIPWGTSAPAELVVGPLDVKRDRRALKTALRVHNSLGGNDLPAALTRAAEVLPPLSPDERALIYVLSDGIEPVTSAMHAAVAGLPPGSVHMCLIDRLKGCTPQMEADWATVAFGSFTRLDHLDVNTMATQMAQIYASALGVSLGPAHSQTRSGRKS